MNLGIGCDVTEQMNNIRINLELESPQSKAQQETTL